MGFCLAVVGMGGAAAVELASRIFAESTLEIFESNTSRSEEDVLKQVQKAYSFANKKILEHVTQNPHHKGMGCTAELLAFSDQGFVLGHIGDSRTYRLRNGQLQQLTHDHTLVQQQVDEGLISSDRAKNHPLRNVILRAVGLDKELALDLIRGKIISGDLFLLCSDGLTAMVPDNQIQEILCSDIDINWKLDKLIETAKAAGGDDNVTVVMSAII
ncbi:MAG: serine/threonine-protein phosphatase [Desulfobacterales bacterium]|nr:MAG: serine/threonine-protein phosphatase [Desulfobacterales bacterium]